MKSPKDLSGRKDEEGSLFSVSPYVARTLENPNTENWESLGEERRALMVQTAVMFRKTRCLLQVFKFSVSILKDGSSLLQLGAYYFYGFHQHSHICNNNTGLTRLIAEIWEHIAKKT